MKEHIGIASLFRFYVLATHARNGDKYKYLSACDIPRLYCHTPGIAVV